MLLIVHQCFLMMLSCKIIVRKATLQTTNKFFFFVKTWWISMKRACMRRSWIFIRIREFLTSVNNANNWGSALDSDSFWRKTRLLWFTRLLTLLISRDIAKKKSESSSLLQSFHHFPYNENPTRALNTDSLKCCLASTDAIDRREKFTYAYEGLRSPHTSALHLNPPFFAENKTWLSVKSLYGR